jgi:LuxR family transcriptional regulator, maltose regulon positive regulatory protein
VPPVSQGVPHPVRHEVARFQLLARLCEHRLIPLVVIVAPAGFGKSTLAAAYARSWSGPAAWLSLRPTDRDPRLLYARLAAEVERAHGGRLSCAELRRGLAAGADGVELARLLALDLATASGPCLLVLDDFHVVQQVDEVGQSVDFLVSTQPVGGQVVITSRDVPPLSLSRFVAADAAYFVGPDQLRLTDAEARDLGAAIGAEPAAVAAAEGWAAGILMGGVAHQPGQAAHEQLFTAYVEREVLAQLTPGERRWLTALAVPDEVTPDVAERLLGPGPWMPRLTRLADHCAFLARAGERHFRLHALIRDSLLERLRREPPAVHARVWERAAALAEEMGDLPGLVRACLELGVLDNALRALRRAVDEDARAGRWPIVLAKLALLPEEHVCLLPDLLLVRARARLQTGDPAGARDAAEAALAVAGRGGATELQASGLVELAAIAHYAGDLDAAETWLDAAAYLVRNAAMPSADAERIEGRLLSVRGICQAVRGEFVGARELLEQSQRVLRRLGPTRERALTSFNLGKLLSEAGYYVDAEQALLAATGDWRAIGDRTALAQAQIALGVLRLRWGDLDGAGPVLHNAVVSARTVGARRLEGYALASLGEWHQANGRLTEAGAAFQEGLGLADEVADGELRAVALRRGAEVALAERDLPAAATLLARAHAEAQRLGSAVQLATVEREQGRLHLAENQPGIARLLLERCVQRGGERWGPHESVPARYWLGTAQLELGEGWAA